MLAVTNEVAVRCHNCHRPVDFIVDEAQSFEEVAIDIVVFFAMTIVSLDVNVTAILVVDLGRRHTGMWDLRKR